MGTPDTSVRHTPVFLDVCLDMLVFGLSNEGGVLVNHTLDTGGYPETILRRFHDTRLINIDRDPQVVALASQHLAPFTDRFTAVQTTYDHVDEAVARYSSSGKANVVFMNLRISSSQFDEVERGFSYSADALLDMRIDPTSGTSAAQLLASVPEKGITRILHIYGKERFASRIVRLIVECRDTESLSRTGQLADTVRAAVPAPARQSGDNPSKRIFQVLRVVVSDESRALEDAVPAALRSLNTDGVLVAEFHQSLEDWIVKKVFRVGSSVGLPPGSLMISEYIIPNLELLTRGACMADDAGITHNPRFASVRLRGVRLICEWKGFS